MALETYYFIDTDISFSVSNILSYLYIYNIHLDTTNNTNLVIRVYKECPEYWRQTIY